MQPEISSWSHLYAYIEPAGLFFNRYMQRLNKKIQKRHEPVHAGHKTFIGLLVIFAASHNGTGPVQLLEQQDAEKLMRKG